RSDGGLFTAVTEMAFAGHVGVTLDLNETDVISALFTEEAGAVLQVTCANSASVQARLRDVGVKVAVVGSLNTDDQVVVSNKGQTLFARDRAELQQIWTETSFRIQSLRDNPECAQQEFDAITAKDPGLSANLSFDINEDIAAPFINTGVRPAVAVLREQGVNSQVEMAAAFHK